MRLNKANIVIYLHVKDYFYQYILFLVLECDISRNITFIFFFYNSPTQDSPVTSLNDVQRQQEALWFGIWDFTVEQEEIIFCTFQSKYTFKSFPTEGQSQVFEHLWAPVTRLKRVDGTQRVNSFDLECLSSPQEKKKSQTTKCHGFMAISLQTGMNLGLAWPGYKRLRCHQGPVVSSHHKQHVSMLNSRHVLLLKLWGGGDADWLVVLLRGKQTIFGCKPHPNGCQNNPPPPFFGLYKREATCQRHTLQSQMKCAGAAEREQAREREQES